MARKTFISYKYSETRNLRDRIINSLGDDADFYRGERSTSPDLSDFKTSTIRNDLKQKIYGTSVTILIISPNMRQSNWISWELEYALKDQKRGNRYSHSNGIVGVIANQYGNSDWFRNPEFVSYYNNQLSQNSCLPDIVVQNRMNKKFREKPFSSLYNSSKNVNRNSYISIVSENTFLSDPNYYIEEAFDKSQHLDQYYICKVSSKDRQEVRNRTLW